MRYLELLAPARDKEIGFAAIDCGADAVYIAGPGFGARQAAGNSMEDVRELCTYAHRFGVRIFITINTIVYDDELLQVKKLLEEASDAGVDGVIDQDLALLNIQSCESLGASFTGSSCTETGDEDGKERCRKGFVLPLHASTQCAIRTPEKARFYEALGFSRIVLERELSLEEIHQIRSAVNCELEFFVHGAICVCYSGQCYMSEYINGRSANRGECIQACRSLYDLEDASGKVLVRNKALLSLKDYNLLHRIEDLAKAGIDSFKIEGRLKNISYVRNVTRAYSLALDDLIARHPDKYRRSSFGCVRGGFTPNLDKTFNRRYTELFIDGKRGKWSSMNAPKHIGEEIGVVARIKEASIVGSKETASRARNASEMLVLVSLKNPSCTLHNGDGFSFLNGDEIIGFRGDVCEGNTIRCKAVPGLKSGTTLYRNVDSEFERELEVSLPARTIDVSVIISANSDGKSLNISAESKDGRTVSFERQTNGGLAKDRERMVSIFKNQISKVSGTYSFKLQSLKGQSLPLLKAAELNAIRRDIAARLNALPCRAIPLGKARQMERDSISIPKTLTYKENIANHLSREMYESSGAESIEPAFEISHREGAELMRTKYCIRYELGLCPRFQHAAQTGSLYLVNNGKRYALGFDCAACEMTVSAATPKKR